MPSNLHKGPITDTSCYISRWPMSKALSCNPPHVPAAQVVEPAGQLLLQAPQWLAEVWRATHEPEQKVKPAVVHTAAKARAGMGRCVGVRVGGGGPRR